MIRWLFTRHMGRDGFMHDRSPAGVIFDTVLMLMLFALLAFALFWRGR